MRNLFVLALLTLAACTSLEPAASSNTAVEACLPATLDQFNGQSQGKDLGARMLKLTGKTEIRWVKPGMMVTMDFQEDRLTVHLDAANRVERANCG